MTVTCEGTERIFALVESEKKEWAVRDFLNQLYATHQTVFGLGHTSVRLIREVPPEELLYPAKPEPTTYNRIVEVKLTLVEAVPGPTNNHDRWRIDVTKQFAPEYGGGEQTFTEYVTQLHRALDYAKNMVTAHPAYRTEAK